MGGEFTPFDPVRCTHYAQFTAHLDRIHFDAIYWCLFLCVIGSLFLASWIYQWCMWYRDRTEFDELVFRTRLKRSLAACSVIFSISAVMIVMETFCLLALQFCDGEDLMSLYWSTWTMLQLGAEIAILGILLALWHQLFNVKAPVWALAMGTPVLVVAGFGHLISLFLKKMYKKAKNKTRSESRSISPSEKATASSRSSMKPRVEQVSRRPSLNEAENVGDRFYFELDVGGDPGAVKHWPSFIRMNDGRAVLHAVLRREDEFDSDLEAGVISPGRR